MIFLVVLPLTQVIVDFFNTFKVGFRSGVGGKEGTELGEGEGLDEGVS